MFYARATIMVVKETNSGPVPMRIIYRSVITLIHVQIQSITYTVTSDNALINFINALILIWQSDQ